MCSCGTRSSGEAGLYAARFVGEWSTFSSDQKDLSFIYVLCEENISINDWLQRAPCRLGPQHTVLRPLGLSALLPMVTMLRAL
jgi:hypothetical protein